MDPILATGIVSLGRGLLDRVLPSPGRVEASRTTGPFKIAANSAEQPLQTVIRESRVQDITDVENLLLHYTHEFLDNPKIAALRDDPNAGELMLTLEDGYFTVESESGQQVTFSADSELGMLGEKIHQLNTLSEMLTESPGATAGELAGAVAMRGGLRGSWSLATIPPDASFN